MLVCCFTYKLIKLHDLVVSGVLTRLVSGNNVSGKKHAMLIPNITFPYSMLTRMWKGSVMAAWPFRLLYYDLHFP